MMQNKPGFSLLELMIVLIIVGILSAICLPIYSEHLIRERRLEAEMNLIKLSNALEKYFLLNNTYEKATLRQLNISDKIADNQYQLQIVSATGSDFLIQAVPLNNQEKKDSLCASLLLNSEGVKQITGNGKITECWE